jgi:hypothetical protein
MDKFCKRLHITASNGAYQCFELGEDL